MRRPQDPQGRPRWPRILVQSRLQSDVVLPACRPPAEVAQHPRRSRGHRQRQVRVASTPCCPPTRPLLRRGELPTCQDNGALICIGQGRGRLYGRRRCEIHCQRRVRPTKTATCAIRRSWPFTMTEEKNSGTNPSRRRSTFTAATLAWSTNSSSLPRAAVRPTRPSSTSRPRALNEKSLTDFIKTHIFDLGTSVCPPYHLAICIGGTSAEMRLDREEGRAGYLDELPTSGNEGGRCFQTGVEEKVLRIRQQRWRPVRRQIPRARRARDPCPAPCGFMPRGPSA